MRCCAAHHIFIRNCHSFCELSNCFSGPYRIAQPQAEELQTENPFENPFDTRFVDDETEEEPDMDELCDYTDPDESESACMF